MTEENVITFPSETFRSKQTTTMPPLPGVVAGVEGLATLLAFEAPLVQHNTFDGHLLHMVYTLIAVGAFHFPRKMTLRKRNNKNWNFRIISN